MRPCPPALAHAGSGAPPTTGERLGRQPHAPKPVRARQVASRLSAHASRQAGQEPRPRPANGDQASARGSTPCPSGASPTAGERLAVQAGQRPRPRPANDDQAVGSRFDAMRSAASPTAGERLAVQAGQRPRPRPANGDQAVGSRFDANPVSGPPMAGERHLPRSVRIMHVQPSAPIPSATRPRAHGREGVAYRARSW
jgi:hypothetical protein